MSLPIAVDAMGGDHAPAEIVRGALRAVREHGITVTLVGRREAVDDALRSAGAATPEGINIVDAREVIEMNEHPANAVRAKRDSSLVSSCALVAGGQARAVISAGNSGAMLAAALFAVQKEAVRRYAAVDLKAFARIVQVDQSAPPGFRNHLQGTLHYLVAIAQRGAEDIARQTV